MIARVLARVWHWISSLLPFRYLRAAGVFILAAWGLWTASRLFARGQESKRLGDAAERSADATVHHLDAAEAEAEAHTVKNKAEQRITELQRNGHRTMAEQLKALNDL